MVEIAGISEGPRALPSLIRFLAILGVLGAAAFGVMLALATFVEPQQREMTQAVPAQKLTGK
jgi:predicted outer membrane lipoprotein